MKYVIQTEIKAGVLNLKFLCGVLVIFVTALMIGQPYLQQLLKSGGTAEGPGWLALYTYGTTAGNILLFIPIAAPFAAGGNAEEELRSRYSLFYCSRLGRRRYLMGKVAGAVLSGGLMVCLAMVLVLAASCVIVGNLPILNNGGGDNTDAFAVVLTDFVRGFLNGALWASVGSLAAIVTRNRYMAYAVPFILYYVLTVFQDRYYRTLFFLSPRYWAAPAYYSNIFCIVILAVLCSITCILLMGAIKRRLSYA